MVACSFGFPNAYKVTIELIDSEAASDMSDFFGVHHRL